MFEKPKKVGSITSDDVIDHFNIKEDREKTEAEYYNFATSLQTKVQEMMDIRDGKTNTSEMDRLDWIDKYAEQYRVIITDIYSHDGESRDIIREYNEDSDKLVDEIIDRILSSKN